MERPIHLQIATVVELHHQITPPQTQPQKQQIQPPLQHLNVGGVLVPKRVPTHHAHGNSPTSRQNTSSRSTARSRTRRGTVKDQSTTINAQEHSSPSSARGTRQRARSGGSSSSPASSSFFFLLAQSGSKIFPGRFCFWVSINFWNDSQSKSNILQNNLTAVS